MRAAIIDDSKVDAERVKSYIQRFAREEALDLSCFVFPDGQSFLSGEHAGMDLIIMDIDMPGLNGIQAARLLRKTDPDVTLMFITNMPQYALAGYEVDAVDYLLKPVVYGEFRLKLKKALRYIRMREDAKITLKTAEGMMQISVRTITYVESELHYTVYHTLERDCRVRGTIGDAEKQLRRYHFSRCNSGYLVNLRYVQAVEKEDVVVNGIRLKMSRGRRNSFFTDFTRYLGGMQI